MQTSITVHVQIAEASARDQLITESQLLGYLRHVLTDPDDPDSVPSLFSAEVMADMGLPEVSSIALSRNGIEFASHSN